MNDDSSAGPDGGFGQHGFDERGSGQRDEQSTRDQGADHGESQQADGQGSTSTAGFDADAGFAASAGFTASASAGASGRTGSQQAGDAPRSASGATASGADEVREQWRIQPGESRIIDIDAVSALKVGVIGGHVDVVGHDERTARVEVHGVERRDLIVTLEHGRLTVMHPKISWDSMWDSLKSLVSDHAKADVSILVPRAIAFSLGQVTADSLVSGLRTSATLSTVSGGLQLESVIGDLELNSVNGDIEVTGAEGAFTAHSVSGEVTASGSLRDVSVDTVSGDVLLDVHGNPRTIGVNTVSASVTLRLDPELGIDGTNRTVSGRGTFAGSPTPKRGGTVRVDGSSGTVVVQVNTVSGDVTAVRRTA